MTIFCFAGSLRQDSSNKKLARHTACLIEELGLTSAEYLDLADYPMVVYDGDVEQSGAPASVAKLGAKIRAAAALAVATPEYNGGISGVLKNAIDWLSRVKPMPLGDKHLLLLSASPGPWGGVRGLWHSRVPFEALGVHVFPQMMSVPMAHTAFDERERMTGERAAQLENLLRAFVTHVTARHHVTKTHFSQTTNQGATP
jgi:NAD(P)H-dependent FMN reductase